MLYFYFAKVVQLRLPLPILRQVIRGARGKQDMTGIAAIHHPLRHVHPRARQVQLVINIFDQVDRPAMNPHPQRQVGFPAQSPINSYCTA
ncbi:MAG: hypothetical protein M3128_04660, partial [Verrucomicrobiota bacterium]|nr:hypothetical protein [Verrucomicrobiota bacterium]